MCKCFCVGYHYLVARGFLLAHTLAMAKKCYVTGAGGMVGTHLVEALHKAGYYVEGSYYNPTVELDEVLALPADKLFEFDIRDHAKMKEYLSSYRPDIIFHLAAQSFPVKSWSDPYYTMDVNVNGTVGLLEAVKDIKKEDPSYDPNIVIISSSAIYGEALLSYAPDNLPDESCPLLPLHPYGVSKVAEDLLAFQYQRNYGLRTCRIRLFNCTGPRKKGDITGDFTYRAVMAEKNGTDTLVVGNLSATRAILDVRDLCSALMILGEKLAPGEAYNICSSHVFKMTHVIECIEEVTGKKFKLIRDQKLLRAADERLYAGRCDKIKALGWEEKLTYLDTVRDMINYWRKKLL